MSFREAERMTAELAAARRDGVSFEQAWRRALATIRPPRERRHGRTAERWAEARTALRFAKGSYRRAYDGEPPTACDSAAQTLMLAMESLYDHSEYAEPTGIPLPEAA